MYNYTPLTNLATSMPAIVARSVIASRNSDPPRENLTNISQLMSFLSVTDAADADGDVTAVGCADPVPSAGTLLRRDGNMATLTCNTSRPGGGGGGGGGESVWNVRCVSGAWHGLASFNCSGFDSSTSRIRTAADDQSWTVGHFFPLDTFPYSQSQIHLFHFLFQFRIVIYDYYYYYYYYYYY